MTPVSCARCGRPLEPGEERRVPALVAEGTAFAFAFFHGGMWAKETLHEPFCPRCVRTVVGAAVAVSAAVLAGASIGLFLWLRGPGR